MCDSFLETVRANLCVCVSCVCLVLTEVRQTSRSSRAGVVDGCEQLHVIVGTESGSFSGAIIAPNTKLSLQTHTLIFL